MGPFIFLGRMRIFYKPLYANTVALVRWPHKIPIFREDMRGPIEVTTYPRCHTLTEIVRYMGRGPRRHPWRLSDLRLHTRCVRCPAEAGAVRSMSYAPLRTPGGVCRPEPSPKHHLGSHTTALGSTCVRALPRAPRKPLTTNRLSRCHLRAPDRAPDHHH